MLQGTLGNSGHAFCHASPLLRTHHWYPISLGVNAEVLTGPYEISVQDHKCGSVRTHTHTHTLVTSSYLSSHHPPRFSILQPPLPSQNVPRTWPSQSLLLHFPLHDLPYQILFSPLGTPFNLLVFVYVCPH